MDDHGKPKDPELELDSIPKLELDSALSVIELEIAVLEIAQTQIFDAMATTRVQ